MIQTDAWGIQDGYEHALGGWRKISAATRAALRSGMNAGPGADEPPATDSVRVIRQGARVTVGAPSELILEDGSESGVEGHLPPDVPLGYHTLRNADGSVQHLIVAPDECYLPADLRTWGWTVQLYASRSAESWGVGDLGDLRRLAHWSSQDLGAGMLMVNPLGAAAPLLPQASSPYFPSSRRFRNPLYIRVEEAPGAAEAGLELDGLASAGRALNHEPLIDRDRVFPLKMDALLRLWRRFRDDGAFARFRAEQGTPLDEFAVFCALAEYHGRGWRSWPEEHRRPDAPAVARFAVDQAERVGFHAWLQWNLDEQLARAGAEIPIMQDLPIGVDPEGADAWAWQTVLAHGVTVGAPPDEFNTRGQNWGLPPFVPHRLRAAGYQQFIQTIRACFRHGGGLRIDHVMGLFRLFWIPDGSDPADGGYVRYQADELLGIVALESQRAGAYVVGEDLGTIEETAREQLAARRILSYRLLWFERDQPSRWPELALAAVTTHDLPTIAGLWTGVDLEEQRALGLKPNEASTREIVERVGHMAGLSSTTPVVETVLAGHRLIAQAPSVLLAATLDDALLVEDRPNLPGTTSERPNWSIALPQRIEDLERAPTALAVAAILSSRMSAAGAVDDGS